MRVQETLTGLDSGYPSVFNTVVPYDNFYMQLGPNRLKAKDIIGMWRYIHNLFVADLKCLDILDKFGRLRHTSEAALDKIYDKYWTGELVKVALTPGALIKPKFLNRLAHVIIQDIVINKMSVESLEWTRIYPVDMLIAPIIQDLYTIINATSTTKLLKFGSDNIDAGPFELRLQYMDNYGFDIAFDVKSMYYVGTITMTNQYGNKVNLVIKSNTRNFDCFYVHMSTRLTYYKGDDLEEFLHSTIFTFGLSKEMNRKRKLLLSVTSSANHDDAYLEIKEA